jgi:hypothetical protein
MGFMEPCSGEIRKEDWTIRGISDYLLTPPDDRAQKVDNAFSCFFKVRSTGNYARAGLPGASAAVTLVL